MQAKPSLHVVYCFGILSKAPRHMFETYRHSNKFKRELIIVVHVLSLLYHVYSLCVISDGDTHFFSLQCQVPFKATDVLASA